ncbi:MAG: PQQ-dependent sugar dehydrogenase [Candidatus Andersenbacteria bacterium]
MPRRIFPLSIGIALLIVIIAALAFYWQYLRGVWPALRTPARDIVELISPVPQTSATTTPMGPLTLPTGFSISIFADDLPGARVLVRDAFGNFWVSQPSQGTVSTIEVRDGAAQAVHPVFRDLQNPHGLAVDPEQQTMLYIAEEEKVSRVPLYSDGSIEPILDLPAGGRHRTRTLGFGPDGRLYLSIGSTCDVCEEADPRHAAIFSFNPDGTDFKGFARGLRNAVFFSWSYLDGRMWATEMGRDMLGDDLPPDEINIIRADGDYGWPNCYGQNILDTDFHQDDHLHELAHCVEPYQLPSHIDLPAHSAPLGLAFIPEEGWPEEYWHDLLVAYHGSWNRTEPTGYKVVRLKLDEQGKYQGSEDFITGWLDDDETLGRPVDLRAEPGGILYVSDDKAGVIYKVQYAQ